MAIIAKIAAEALLVAVLAIAAPAMAASDPGVPRAPQMQFVPPAAGTYSLQHIQASPDAALLDSSAHPLRLSELTRGKITLLTFFYTHCTDPLGCPYALGLMSTLRDRMASDSDLRQNVRFVSISFDPTYDSPRQLRSFAHGLATKAGFEWDFVTTPSIAVLQPLLDDFGQDVRIEQAGDGRAARTMNHMLKLFLIDPRGSVREIYALDYLQPEVMLNDLRTLRLEARTVHTPPTPLSSKGTGESVGLAR